MSKTISAGVVHKMPTDLRKALTSDRAALAAKAHQETEEMARFDAVDGEGWYLIRAVDEPQEPWQPLCSTESASLIAQGET